MVEHFKDYRKEEILLAEDVWENHIGAIHPEITKDVIAETLKTPDVVCDSQHRNMKGYRLYYKGPWKNKKKKNRYHRVVVKICNDGNWISTAHIRGSISCGVILFKAGEK